ncbi:uncharacterized protein [Montipora foliosa]|uniref:uncharacterized protein n=1 Tax=Montipora foliosa TaxID=591990 RepID=UPI0035F1A8D5
MQFISELITRKKKLYIVFLKRDARQKKHDSDDPNGKCNNELTWLTTEMGNEDLLVDKDHKQHDGKSKADDQAISNLELISESETSEDGCDGEEQGPPLKNIDLKPKRKPKVVDNPTSKESLANTESESEDDHFFEQQVSSSKRIDPKRKSKKKPKSKSTKEMVDALKCKVGTSDAVDNLALSRKAAEVIICVAFNAINVKEISRSQLAAATKPLKLKLKSSLSKEEYLKPVADGLIKAGYVKLTKELSHDTIIVRDDIILLKPF